MPDKTPDITWYYAKDLALIYAKSRLDDAYRQGMFKEDPEKMPNSREFEYLLECFEAAYTYYKSIAISNPEQ